MKLWHRDVAPIEPSAWLFYDQNLGRWAVLVMAHRPRGAWKNTQGPLRSVVDAQEAAKQLNAGIRALPLLGLS